MMQHCFMWFLDAESELIIYLPIFCRVISPTLWHWLLHCYWSNPKVYGWKKNTSWKKLEREKKQKLQNKASHERTSLTASYTEPNKILCGVVTVISAWWSVTAGPDHQQPLRLLTHTGRYPVMPYMSASMNELNQLKNAWILSHRMFFYVLFKSNIEFISICSYMLQKECKGDDNVSFLPISCMILPAINS